MIEDRVVAGGISGMIGAFALGLIVIAANTLGLTTIPLFYWTSMVFLPDAVASTPFGSIYGFVMHLIIGSIIGVLFVHFFPATGRDFLLYKGVFLGGLVWLFVGGLVSNIFNIPVRGSLADMSVLTIANLVFGVVTVVSANRMLDTTT